MYYNKEREIIQQRDITTEIERKRKREREITANKQKDIRVVK